MRNFLFWIFFLSGCTFPHRKNWLIIENYSSPDAHCYYLFNKEVYFTENSLYWYSKSNKKEVFQYKILKIKDYSNLQNQVNFDLKRCKNGESIL